MRVPSFLLIGLNQKTIHTLNEFLGTKYNFLIIDQEFDTDKIRTLSPVIMAIIDTYSVKIKPDKIIKKIRESKKFSHIPIIGLVMKQHMDEIGSDSLKMFDDIILMPCGNEDLLTRIEVWIRTFEMVNNPQNKEKSVNIEHTNI